MSEETQVCYTCKKTLPLGDFRKHSNMKNGHLGKCKGCVAIYDKNWAARLKLDPIRVEKRNRWHRDHRRVTERKPRTPEQKRRARIRRMKLYPEKTAANVACQYFPKTRGFHNHHWSYQAGHHFDVITLPIAQHYLAHRFMTYDQERMMYRRMDGTLIDSREAAIAYYATLKDDTPTQVTTKGTDK